MLILGYVRFLFREFETYLRIVVVLYKDVIQLILKQSNSNFLPKKYLQALTQFRIYQRLFTPWVIMKGPYELNTVTLARKQKLF